MIDKTKQYTIDGHPVEILATDISGCYPVLVKWTTDSGDVVCNRFTIEGAVSLLGEPRLVEVKKKKKCWVALKTNGTARIGDTRVNAIKNFRVLAELGPTACIEVEYEEGQGL